MDVLELLKEFKKIEPDKNYTLRSKMEILGAISNEKKLWSFMWPSLRLSTATLITGFLIMVIFASFSIIKFSAPVKFSSLDPISLKAEAEAIDIQINLAKLGYENPVSIVNQTTTVKIGDRKNESGIRNSNQEQVLSKTSEATEQEQPPLSIDETLRILSR